MLSRKDLQKRWGISQRTLDRWRKFKNIPEHILPVNGHVYFKEEEIEVWEKKWLNGRED